MGAGPLVHGDARGGGENGEEAEGVRFRPSPRAETVYRGLSMEMGGPFTELEKADAAGLLLAYGQLAMKCPVSWQLKHALALLLAVS
jgi:hypothetical protein